MNTRITTITQGVAKARATPRFSGNLDVLRSSAVMCVFFAHLVSAAGFSNPGSLGRFGVVIFFVHTSYVLMASLHRMESGPGSDWWLCAAFWIRRIFRIYPLALFFVVLTPLFHIPPGPGAIYHWLGIKAFLSNLALIQNLTYSRDALSPLWSLPLEVQMYVLLPLCYFVVRGKRYRSLALWVISVVLAMTIPRVAGRLNVFSYAPCFVSGIVAFDLSNTSKRKLPGWTWPIAVIALIALFGPLDDISLPDKLYRAWALSLLLGVLIACTREGSGRLFHKVAHLIAEYSYGIYLSHVIVFWIVIDQMATSPVWARILVLVAGSVGIPVALYHSLEKPLIVYGARIAVRHNPSPPHLTASKARQVG